MIYKELQEKLNLLTSEQLNTEVTIVCSEHTLGSWWEEDAYAFAITKEDSNWKTIVLFSF